MKLLLDEMWPPGIAVQLRLRGHDVIAVAEQAALRGAPDDEVFRAAQTEGRAIVTENVGDYRVLAAAELAHGGSHKGLIFTSNRSFPRHLPSTLGRVVTALDHLLLEEPDAASRELWLA